MTYGTLLMYLLAGHALCDYPLQGDFLAQGKNRHTAVGAALWPHCLAAHSVIHGGMVAVLTGSLALGVLETVIHAGTDYAKCEGWISYNMDQAIHAICKAVWAAVAVWWLA